MISTLTDIALLTLLAVTAIAIVRLRGLMPAIVLAGVYSLLSAGLLTTLDAIDVALTEAAVGAGITTVLLIATVALTGAEEAAPTRRRRRLLPLGVVIITGAALIYGTLDAPPFGSPDAPAQLHVAPRYLEQSGTEIGIPNVVTSVLASYRGYDTLGEVVVVFTAAVGVLMLLGAERPRRRHDGDRED